MKVEYRNKRLPINEQIYLVTDYNAGIKIKDLMEKYGVSKGTIYNILKKQVTETELKDYYKGETHEN